DHSSCVTTLATKITQPNVTIPTQNAAWCDMFHGRQCIADLRQWQLDKYPRTERDLARTNSALPGILHCPDRVRRPRKIEAQRWNNPGGRDKPGHNGAEKWFLTPARRRPRPIADRSDICPSLWRG